MWPIPIFTDVQVKTITATPSRCPGSKGDHRDPHWRVSLKLNMECRNVQPLSCNKLHFHVDFPREIIYEKLNKTAGFKTGENHRKPLAPSHIFFFLIDILLGLSAKWGMPKEYVCKCIYIYMHMGTMSLVSTMDNLRFQFSFSAFPQGFQPATSGSHPGAEFQSPDLSGTSRNTKNHWKKNKLWRSYDIIQWHGIFQQDSRNMEGIPSRLQDERPHNIFNSKPGRPRLPSRTGNLSMLIYHHLPMLCMLHILKQLPGRPSPWTWGFTARNHKYQCLAWSSRCRTIQIKPNQTTSHLGRVWK